MIKLTSEAVIHFKQILKNNPHAVGIKLGIKSSGCSGNSYILDLLIKLQQHDKFDEFVCDGDIKFFIDKSSQEALKGTEVDYVKDSSGINSSIKFKNPNVTGECGCGESFSVGKPPSTY